MVQVSFNHILRPTLLLLALPMVAELSFGAVLPTFADIAARAKLNVVNIRTNQRMPVRTTSRDPYQFFLNEKLPASTTTQSLGSGVIVSGAGLILTNYHVVVDATAIEVVFANKKRAEAKIVGTDPKTDLALLRAKLPAGVAPADLGDSDKLRVGDWVLAIGNPFGYEHTVTSGIISATGRVIGAGPYDNFLQTDTPIHPGNSGGPLIDMRGRVIGINAAVEKDTYGIGFATPINIAKGVIRDLSTHGVVNRAWLGAVCQSINSDDSVIDASSSAGSARVVVANLVVDSPAHRAGLKLGDLILAVDGKRLRSVVALQTIMLEKKPKQSLKLTIYRKNVQSNTMTIDVILSNIPKSDDLPADKDLL